MLLYIADELNNQKYGTFLGDCEKDRISLKVSSQTESMFDYILMEKAIFQNELYEPFTNE